MRTRSLILALLALVIAGCVASQPTEVVEQSRPVPQTQADKIE